MARDPFTNSLLTPKTLLVAGIVVVGLVFLGLLVFGSPAEIEVAEEEAPEVAVLQEAGDQAEETPQLPTTAARELDESCEDYSFKQGERAELDGTDLFVKRIGRSGVILVVDEREFMISEADNERVGDFLVELADGDILYFGADDPDNTVLFRLGCLKASEDPNDKYIREKGEVVCEELYTACQDEFDLE